MAQAVLAAGCREPVGRAQRSAAITPGSHRSGTHRARRSRSHGTVTEASMSQEPPDPACKPLLTLPVHCGLNTHLKPKTAKTELLCTPAAPMGSCVPFPTSADSLHPPWPPFLPSSAHSVSSVTFRQLPQETRTRADYKPQNGRNPLRVTNVVRSSSLTRPFQSDVFLDGFT